MIALTWLFYYNSLLSFNVRSGILDFMNIDEAELWVERLQRKVDLLYLDMRTYGNRLTQEGKAAIYEKIHKLEGYVREIKKEQNS